MNRFHHKNQNDYTVFIDFLNKYFPKIHAINQWVANSWTNTIVWQKLVHFDKNLAIGQDEQTPVHRTDKSEQKEKNVLLLIIFELLCLVKNTN